MRWTRLLGQRVPGTRTGTRPGSGRRAGRGLSQHLRRGRGRLSAQRLRATGAASRVQTEPGRAQPLLAALLLTALWWVAAQAVEPVLAPGGWQTQVLAVSACALLVPGAVRTLWPSRPVVGLACGLVAATGVLLAVQAGTPYPQAWLQDPEGSAQALRHSVLTSVPPVEVSGVLGSGVLLAVLVMSWACAVLSAGGADVTGATGLVPAVCLLLPVAIRGQAPSRPELLAVAACLLGLVVTAAPVRHWPALSHDPGRSHGPSAARRLAGLGMGVVSLLLGVGLSGLPSATTEQVWVAQEGQGTTPELSLTLSRDLVRGSRQTALSYSGDVARGTSLRLTLGVITDLEPGVWQPEQTTTSTEVTRLQPPDGQGALTAGGALARAGVSTQEVSDAGARGRADGSGSPAGSLTVLRVQVQSLTTRQLPTLQSTALVTDAGAGAPASPGGSAASTASAGPGASGGPGGSGGQGSAAAPSLDLEQWRWVEGTSTATSRSQSLGPGADYTLVGWSSVADASGQPATQAPVEPAPAGDTLAAYTSLPAGTPASVTQAAQEVVAQAGVSGAGGSGSPDGAQDVQGAEGTAPAAQTAAALAAWLRGGDFTYDESAPYDTAAATAMDLVESFLEQRHGYCVHFASAFTVMARSLGLPTRIAVGYATVSEGPGQWTQVTGEQLHAWPEVWVEGTGWVAYEPTPGGAGAAADQDAAADPEPAQPPAPTTAAPEPSQGASDPASTQTASEAGSAGGAGNGPDLVAVVRGALVVLVVLACLVAPAGARVLQGRRRRQLVAAGRSPAAAAWAELVALGVDLGLLGPGGRGGQEQRARTHEATAERLVAALDSAPAGSAGSAASGGVTGAGRGGPDASPAGSAGSAGSPGASRPGGASGPDLGRGSGTSGAGSAQGAVLLLAKAAVAETYGPGTGQGGQEDKQVDKQVDKQGERLLAVLAQASGGLRGVVGRRRRLLARVLPASVLGRGLDGTGSSRGRRPGRGARGS